MSTLHWSIIALVVLVLVIVIAHNLWQNHRRAQQEGRLSLRKGHFEVDDDDDPQTGIGRPTWLSDGGRDRRDPVMKGEKGRRQIPPSLAARPASVQRRDEDEMSAHGPRRGEDSARYPSLGVDDEDFVETPFENPAAVRPWSSEDDRAAAQRMRQQAAGARHRDESARHRDEGARHRDEGSRRAEHRFSAQQAEPGTNGHYNERAGGHVVDGHYSEREAGGALSRHGSERASSRSADARHDVGASSARDTRDHAPARRAEHDRAEARHPFDTDLHAPSARQGRDAAHASAAPSLESDAAPIRASAAAASRSGEDVFDDVDPATYGDAYEHAEPAGGYAPLGAGHESDRAAAIESASDDDLDDRSADMQDEADEDFGPLPDAPVEHVVILEPPAPVNTDRLVVLTSSLRHVGGKPVRVEVERLGGHWGPLTAGEKAVRVRCSLLLANRQGPLNAVELSDFNSAVEALAEQLQAPVNIPDMAPILRNARELDVLAAKLDTQIELVVELPEPAELSVVTSLVRQLGLSDKGNGRYEAYADSGDMLFGLAFNSSRDQIGFVLDVPRVAQQYEAWEGMVACASSMAQALGGRLVDSTGRGMSVGMISTVSKQLAQRYAQLAQLGLTAGGPAAMRVFH